LCASLADTNFLSLTSTTTMAEQQAGDRIGRPAHHAPIP
jgi:hypothetical protein